jgi:uracil-DNA glycosylase family 4
MGFLGSNSWRTKTKKQPTLARCGACGLAKKCVTPKMAPVGSGRRKILIIYGAPERKDDQQGRHFIDARGDVFRDVLQDVGIDDIDDIWVSYAVLCRPMDDRITTDNVNACRPALLKFITQHKPQVIIPMGLEATKSMLEIVAGRNIDNIEQWVGWKIPVGEYNAWVCPTYDPIMLETHQSGDLILVMMKRHLKNALKMENQVFDCRSLSDWEKQVDICDTDKKATRALKKIINSSGGLLAFDYETTSLKPDKAEQKIVSISFCLNGEYTCALRMTNAVKPLVSKLLLDERFGKIASNAKFEERWTRAKLGHGVANWDWDTMIAAHILDNRKRITSAKFQALVHLGIADYSSHIQPYIAGEFPNESNKMDKLNVHDLLLYNGLDSILEYAIAERQKDLFQ